MSTVSKIALGLVVLLGLLTLNLRLDHLVESAIETRGPRITQTAVSVGSVDLAPWSGDGALEAVVVGNPGGFEGPHIFRLGQVDVQFDLPTLFDDVIVIESPHIDRAAVHVEQAGLDLNLRPLIAAVQGDDDPSGRRFVIRELRLTNGQGTLAAEVANSQPFPIPDLLLTDVGAAEESVTARELARQLVQPVVQQTVAAAAEAGLDSGGSLVDQIGDLPDMTRWASESLSNGVSEKPSQVQVAVPDRLPGGLPAPPHAV